MSRQKKQLTDEQKAECARLKSAFAADDRKNPQTEFTKYWNSRGQAFDKSSVSQHINAHTAIPDRFVLMYAQWLNIPVSHISTSLADFGAQIHQTEDPQRTAIKPSGATGGKHLEITRHLNKLMPEQLLEVLQTVEKYATQNEAIYHHLHKQMGGALLAQTGDFAGKPPNPFEQPGTTDETAPTHGKTP